MAFYSGQKVVCVDGKPGERARWVGPSPQEGEVYTCLGAGWRKDTIAIREIRRVGTDQPASFLAYRFRPLAEPKTDISIFRKALTGDFVDA